MHGVKGQNEICLLQNLGIGLLHYFKEQCIHKYCLQIHIYMYPLCNCVYK